MIDERDDLLEDLNAAQASGRSDIDRYREFRQVFLGTDAGKRVLRDIIGWGRIWRHKTAAKGDPYETYRRLGEQDMVKQIVNTLYVEPKTPPVRQQSRPPEEERDGR